MWPFSKSEWQLVIEISGDSPERFEKAIALQEEMAEGMISGEIDGNDVGCGVVNIFIFTKSPTACFSEALTYFERHQIQPTAAGARKVNEDDYVRLWPKTDSSPFKLK